MVSIGELLILIDSGPNDKRIAQGSPVKLLVSKGPPGVAVPSVVGLAAADAVKRLQAQKLVTYPDLPLAWAEQRQALGFA